MDKPEHVLVKTQHNNQFQFKVCYIWYYIRTNCIETQVKNFIKLLGKYFIFKNKYQETRPTLEHFKLYLSQRIKVEKYIYFTTDRIAQFDRKWGKLKTLIDK